MSAADASLLPLQLSLQELRDAVVSIYENRRNLAATLTDTRNVVANLERVMTGVVQFVLFFGYLAIWDVRALPLCDVSSAPSSDLET